MWRDQMGVGHDGEILPVSALVPYQEGEEKRYQAGKDSDHYGPGNESRRRTSEAEHHQIVFHGWRNILTPCEHGFAQRREGRNLSTTMGHSTGLIREQCPVW